MTILLAIALVAGGLPGWFAAGRQFPRSVEVRGFWWIPIALIFQIAALRSRSVIGLEASALLLLLASVTLLYALWLNRRYVGSWIAATGILLNVTVMVANGGYMPLGVGVLERSGHRPGAVTGDVPDRSKGQVVPDAEIRLAVLADWIPKPGGGVMSVGDIVLALGIGIFAWELMVGESARYVRGTRGEQRS